MANITEVKGAMTALVTPFGADGGVDYEALGRIVDAQLERGISGLVPCGTTGETPCLTLDEQERVTRTVVDRVAGRVPVVAGTGSNSTASTVAQTKLAKTWGIDAALVVCPYYNKPTQEGLYEHFREVAEEGGLPVVVYNVPGRTASDIRPDTLGRLAEGGHAHAVKDATADMRRIVENRAAVGDRPFAFLSGDDFSILGYVASGGDGVISVVSNIAPGDTVRLVHETQTKQLQSAQKLNDRIVELTSALFLSSNPIPVKAAMAVSGWCDARVRKPLVTADEALTAKVKEALHHYRGSSDDLRGFMA